MGIKSLNNFLRNNCPQVFEEIHISEYGYKKVAVDVSLFMCKFKAICGPRWLGAFLNLVSCLRKNNIHCVFIYDTGAPTEKTAEREERAVSREKIEKKVFDISDALEHYHTTSEVRPILVELDKKLKGNAPRRLLGTKKETSVDIKSLEIELERIKGQILNVTKEDFELTKKLFVLLDVPFYDAPLEAETMCADLCKRGLVDAVLSEDTDVLAYGSPIFLSKIDTSSGTCIRVCYKEMLKALELTQDEFLDLCIMCGTDYNKNIPRIGPEKAYKLLLQHRTIENIASAGLDVSILNHSRTREIFKEYERVESIKIPYCGKPNYNKLMELMVVNNIRIGIDGLKKNYEAEIIFAD